MPINHSTTGPGIGGPEWEEDHTVPTLAEVLAEGNDADGTAITGLIDLTFLSSAVLHGGDGQQISLNAGNVALVGATGAASGNGKDSSLIGGDGDEGNGGIAAYLDTYGGKADGTGGGGDFVAGAAGAGSDADGGGIDLTGGFGDGTGAGGRVQIGAGHGTAGDGGYLGLFSGTNDAHDNAGFDIYGASATEDGHISTYGQIVFNGPVDYNGHAPTLAEVLAEGADTGEVPLTGSGGAVQIGSGGQGDVIILSGGGQGYFLDDAGDDAGWVWLRAHGAIDAGLIGGRIQIDGGGGNDSDGSQIVLVGGDDSGGGAVEINGGDGSTDQQGGDITLTPGAGDGAGRNGLVFLNLPTSDPGVSGALYSLAGVVKVSA